MAENKRPISDRALFVLILKWRLTIQTYLIPSVMGNTSTPSFSELHVSSRKGPAGIYRLFRGCFMSDSAALDETYYNEKCVIDQLHAPKLPNLVDNDTD